MPHEHGYLLQLARDLVPAIAKRLSMFVLRSKVKIADASASWVQVGVDEVALAELGIKPLAEDLALAHTGDRVAVRMAAQRYLLIAPQSDRARLESLSGMDEASWALEEIRSGRPLVTQATQDQFVPQMVNYERFGAVDFQKGCYPGQEIVARAQYRGQVKRRMVRVRTPVPLRAGQDVFSDDLPGQASGTVVNAAGGEALAVVQLSSLEGGAALRAASTGAPLEVLPLPYAA